MSRNGTSYLFQLLAGHESLFLYPARILIACARPRGWPFFGTWDLPVDEFAARLADRNIVYLYDGDLEPRSCTILESGEVDADRFLAEFRARARRLGSHVDVSEVRESFTAFVESIVMAYGPAAEAAYGSSRYTVFQDDHLFNLGIATLAQAFPDAFTIQIIRNLYDVLASRKKLLLVLSGFRGDPRRARMSREALEAEAIRWVWSVIAAHRNERAFPDRSVILSFERLKRETEHEMHWLCARLAIEFHPLLLREKSSAKGVFTKNSLLESRSTLGQLTGGKRVGVVRSYPDVLGEEELREIERICEGLDWQLPEADGATMSEALAGFAAKNAAFIESKAPLAQWLEYHEQGLNDRLLEEYSAYNFGLADIARAFPTGLDAE
jgi:hypothetical protein